MNDSEFVDRLYDEYFNRDRNNDIYSHRLLTREEENRLFKIGTDDAHDLLTVYNQKLVRSIAREFDNRTMELEDRISEANKVLIKTIRIHDPRRSKLSTHYVKVARLELRKACSNKGLGTMIEIPDYAVPYTNQVKVISDTLEQQLGRTPEESELYLNESFRKVQRDSGISADLLFHFLKTYRINERPLDYDKVIELIADEWSSAMIDEMEQMDMVKNCYFKPLSKKEKIVVMHLHLFKESRSSVAKRINVKNVATVSDYSKRAIEKIRKLILNSKSLFYYVKSKGFIGKDVKFGEY